MYVPQLPFCLKAEAYIRAIDRYLHTDLHSLNTLGQSEFDAMIKVISWSKMPIKISKQTNDTINKTPDFKSLTNQTFKYSKATVTSRVASK